jgi:5-methylcytosine-specific restriction endonuclease McrA
MERAQYRCEYCRIHEDDSFLGFQVDHVISIKHGGETKLENLAWSCFACNNNKGSDIATILFPDKRLVRLFNPREEVWEEHFEVISAVIHPTSEIGEATIKLLKMNEVDRIIERQALDG